MIGSLSSSSSWTTSIPTRQTCPYLSGVLCACMHIVMYRAIEQHCSTRLLLKRKQNTSANIEVTSRHAEHTVVCLMIFEGWYALSVYQNEQDKTSHLEPSGWSSEFMRLLLRRFTARMFCSDEKCISTAHALLRDKTGRSDELLEQPFNLLSWQESEGQQQQQQSAAGFCASHERA